MPENLVLRIKQPTIKCKVLYRAEPFVLLLSFIEVIEISKNDTLFHAKLTIKKPIQFETRPLVNWGKLGALR